VVAQFSDRYGPWAVVTGAAQGVGLAFAEAIMARGCSVVFVDKDPSVSAVASRFDGAALGVEADLSQVGWLDGLDAATDGLDIGLAVANAAVSYVGPFLQQSSASVRAATTVNCQATTELASWVLPRLVARGRGGFVVTSSGSALAGTGSVATYSATKAYVLNLAEAIGWEVRDHGVDCLALVAPAMDTPGWRSHPIDESKLLQPPADPRHVVDAALDRLPEGGCFLADPGLEMVAGMDRAARVRLLSEATSAMYPAEYPQ
jgi:uncharacterized protein